MIICSVESSFFCVTTIGGRTLKDTGTSQRKGAIATLDTHEVVFAVFLPPAGYCA